MSVRTLGNLTMELATSPMLKNIKSSNDEIDPLSIRHPF